MTSQGYTWVLLRQCKKLVARLLTSVPVGGFFVGFEPPVFACQNPIADWLHDGGDIGVTYDFCVLPTTVSLIGVGLFFVSSRPPGVH